MFHWCKTIFYNRLLILFTDLNLKCFYSCLHNTWFLLFINIACTSLHNQDTFKILLRFHDCLYIHNPYQFHIKTNTLINNTFEIYLFIYICK